MHREELDRVGAGKRKEREQSAHDHEDQRPTNGEDSSNDVNTIVRRRCQLNRAARYRSSRVLMRVSRPLAG
jgi:hypothetical protein